MNASATMPQFVVDFGSLGQAPDEGRLDAPAFHRNHEAIWGAIAEFLASERGDVLEVGSGTGQHAAAFARRAPQLTWWPSDILPSHLASIEGWRRRAGLANLREPQRIDLTDPAWSWSGNAGALTAILCINTVHISPWRVSQNLMAGAGRLLPPDGRLFIYGPFKRDGAHTAPSNVAFDATLRAENPEWGVRDVGDFGALAQAVGLTLVNIVKMPANNQVLAFARADRQT
jgi:SAM-dependent methyltransferase